MEKVQLKRLPDEVAEQWAESIVEDAQLEYEGEDWYEIECGEGFNYIRRRYSFKTTVEYMDTLIELWGDIDDGSIKNFLMGVVKGDDELVEELDWNETEMQIENYVSDLLN